MAGNPEPGTPEWALQQHQIRCDEELLRQQEIFKEAMRHAMEAAVRYQKDEAERAELRQKMEMAHAEQRESLLRLHEQQRARLERVWTLPDFKKVLKDEMTRNAKQENELKEAQQKTLAEALAAAEGRGANDVENEERRKSIEEQHREQLKKLALEQQERMDRLVLLYKGPPERER